MAPSLLDTDTLSHYLRGRDPEVRQRGADHLADYGRFRFSLITRYEIVRGLKARGATRQLEDFAVFCGANEVLPITDEVVLLAAELYASLRKRGELLPDADLFIAATAMVNGLTLVTCNLAHFRRIPGLALDCWT